MENTYWNGTGKYQTQFDELIKLMPASGSCDTMAGELIRAANRLAYDFYNNGMGNNTSGAVNYLDHYSAIDPDTYSTIYEYTRGRIYNGRFNGDELQQAIEHMVDSVVEFITRNPQLITMERNHDDVFTYQEPEQIFCDECGDETDRGYMCESCEDAYYEDEEMEY
jgi:hypothetical protein